MELEPDNRVAFINEVLVSCYLYLLIVLTDFNVVCLFRPLIGFFLLSTVFISIIISIAKTITQISGAIRLKLNLKRAKKNA